MVRTFYIAGYRPLGYFYIFGAMQAPMRRIVENTYTLPLIVVLICIWRFFMPQLPAFNGLGWDGSRYYSLTVGAFQSHHLDSYLVLRLFSCLFIHTIFTVLGIAFTPASVI